MCVCVVVIVVDDGFTVDPPLDVDVADVDDEADAGVVEVNSLGTLSL